MQTKIKHSIKMLEELKNIKSHNENADIKVLNDLSKAINCFKHIDEEIDKLLLIQDDTSDKDLFEFVNKILKE